MVAEQALGNGPLGVFSIVNGDRHPSKGFDTGRYVSAASRRRLIALSVFLVSCLALVGRAARWND